MSAPINTQLDTQAVSAVSALPVSKSLAGLRNGVRWLVPLLLLLLATAFLYRAPYSASSLEIVPDSVEYAVGAQRIALLGRYDIEINHVVYPPRYAPWFSLILSPIYRLTHGAMGSGILIVFAFALAGILALYALGCRLGAEWSGMRAEWGGAGTVLCVLSFKEYRRMAGYVMTDIPVCAIGLFCCLLFIRMQTRSRGRDYALAGLLAGLAAAMRYEGFVVLLPFVVLIGKTWKTQKKEKTEKTKTKGTYQGTTSTLRRKFFGGIASTRTLGEVGETGTSFVPVTSRISGWKNMALLCAPVACVICVTALYNAHTFGSWRRSGYHYWTAVPYDFPSLVWSPRYLGSNVFALAAKQSVLIMLLGLVGLLLLRRKPNPALRSALQFLGWACVPAGIAHLFYFSADVRFYLPALTLWGAIGGAGLAAFLTALLPSKVMRSRRWLVCGVATALLASPLIRRAFDREPQRRHDADALARLTPLNAIIVTELDPVYLEPFVLRGTQRRVIPLTRQVEYASKVVAPQRIANPVPPPRSAHDARSPGIIAGGAREVIPYTADEAPKKVSELAQSGIPVYVDLRFAPVNLNVAALFRSAQLTDIREYPWLKRLRTLSAPIKAR